MPLKFIILSETNRAQNKKYFKESYIQTVSVDFKGGSRIGVKLGLLKVRVRVF